MVMIKNLTTSMFHADRNSYILKSSATPMKDSAEA